MGRFHPFLFLLFTHRHSFINIQTDYCHKYSLGYSDNHSITNNFDKYRFACLFNLFADVKIHPWHFLSVFITKLQLHIWVTRPKVTKGLFSFKGVEILNMHELLKKSV